MQLHDIEKLECLQLYQKSRQLPIQPLYYLLLVYATMSLFAGDGQSRLSVSSDNRPSLITPGFIRNRAM